MITDKPFASSSYNVNLKTASPKQALMFMRIIWAGLLVGPLVFMGIVAFQISQNPAPANKFFPLLFTFNLDMAAFILPVTLMVRNITHRRSRNPDGTVPMSKYFSGNLIFWAGCEGVSFFGVIVALFNRTFWPTILIVLAAMALQLLTYPKRSSITPPTQTFEIK